MSLVDDGVYDLEYINYRIIHFDDLIFAMVTIIQMITLEGWSLMMYNLMDTSQVWMAITFCILLVIIGAWFLLNVILAVIMQAFEDVDKNTATQDAKIRKAEHEAKRLYEIDDSDLSSSSSEQSINEIEDDEPVSVHSETLAVKMQNRIEQTSK